MVVLLELRLLQQHRHECVQNRVVGHGSIVMRRREAEVPVTDPTVLLKLALLLNTVNQMSHEDDFRVDSHDPQKKENALSLTHNTKNCGQKHVKQRQGHS